MQTSSLKVYFQTRSNESMKIENLLSVNSREELRHWLEKNSIAEACCWVVVSMKQAPETVLYLDAVEEALCFGWIDGTKKKVSETKLAQRLSPRSKKSSWTELNKERARRLEKLGLMTEAGRKVLPDMSEESFIIHPLIVQRLQEDAQVYENYTNFPELYKRVRIDTIQSYKNQPDVFNSKLEKFINNTKLNKMYGQWNDHGRLSLPY